MEPPSPIRALGVNPFPITFINRTVTWRGFALNEKRANENREMTVVRDLASRVRPTPNGKRQATACRKSKKIILF